MPRSAGLDSLGGAQGPDGGGHRCASTSTLGSARTGIPDRALSGPEAPRSSAGSKAVREATEAARTAAVANPNIARGVGITGRQFRWPSCQIPYEIDPTCPTRNKQLSTRFAWKTLSNVDHSQARHGWNVSSGIQSLGKLESQVLLVFLQTRNLVRGWTSQRENR